MRSTRVGNLPFEEIEFPLAQDAAAAPVLNAELPKSLPNIAALERADETPSSPQARQDAEPHLTLFADDADHPEPPVAAEPAPPPAPAPAQPIDPLAPIMALSDEERIALFS